MGGCWCPHVDEGEDAGMTPLLGHPRSGATAQGRSWGSAPRRESAFLPPPGV